MDEPLVYQLSRQRQRWVATFGREETLKASKRETLPKMKSP